MSRKIKVKDCAGCPYYRYNRGTPDWCENASWIEDGYFDEPCVCSNCGEPCKDTVMGKPRWNYCPNCGAKMDGGQDE